MSDTFTIDTEHKKQDLWEATMGSGWESDPVINAFCTNVEYFGDTDWDKIGTFKLTYYNEDEEEREITLGIADLERGLRVCMDKHYRHVPCGGVIDTDFDNWDSCVASLVIQVAIFGEEVYA